MVAMPVVVTGSGLEVKPPLNVILVTVPEPGPLVGVKNIA
jgi:hypothetical protein